VSERDTVTLEQLGDREKKKNKQKTHSALAHWIGPPTQTNLFMIMEGSLEK
jgi:hypothetical protein